MPTASRGAFLRNAVRLFEAQDHRARELIVVVESDDDEAAVPTGTGIRVVRAGAEESIGRKRNRACAAAAGDYIAHWDDDDWYGPHRLSAQLAPLIAGDADICALRTGLVLELEPWRFWRISAALHRQLFVHDVHGGTLVYRREVWERLARYPDASLAEDALMLGAAVRYGARLARVPGEGLFIYVRHGANAWRFSCGEHGGPDGWTRSPPPPLSADDLAFYAGRRRKAKSAIFRRAPTARPSRRPLVSCIMPTADRRCFVGRAIAQFEGQDYPNRELVILDDGRDRVADVIPSDPRVRYVPLKPGLTLGAKRNRACELARGSVILHWDDDDWHAQHRIGYQVERLLASGRDICGPDQLLYHDPARSRAWLYVYPPDGPRPWVAGAALCYRREAWREAPFADVPVGEDTRFVGARTEGSVHVLEDHRFLVARLHERNSDAKPTATREWRVAPLAEVRRVLSGLHLDAEGAHGRGKLTVL